jgi:HEPN domain-containing protein
MRPAEADDLALEWLRYAEEDLRAAEALAEDAGVAPRQACLLSQQAAEKALKSIFVFLQHDFPRTHNLNALRNLLPPGWAVASHFPDLAKLGGWAVEARYPGDWPEPDDADAEFAVSQAAGLVAAVRTDLAQHGLDLPANRVS